MGISNQSQAFIRDRLTLLEQLDLGGSVAENELQSIDDYYHETDIFHHTLRGEVRLVIGRKGAGKTAAKGKRPVAGKGAGKPTVKNAGRPVGKGTVKGAGRPAAGGRAGVAKAKRVGGAVSKGKKPARRG